MKPIYSKYLVGIFLLFLVGLQNSCTRQTTDEKIFYNGRIFTLNPSQPEAEAVATRKDKIVAVGTLEFVKSKVSARISLIDLKGKFLLPGLIDSHNHAIKGGERLLAAHLNDDLLPIDEFAAFANNALTSGKGARGNGLYITGIHSAMWSDIDKLDSLFNNDPYRDRPVMLLGTDGHTAWGNSVLLKKAGVDREFINSLPSSDRPYYGVKENNEPNGFVSENAIQKISNAMPPSSVTSYKGASSGVKHLNSLGITAWLDPSAGEISEGIRNEKLEAYRQLAERKELSAHVATVVVANVNDDIQHQLRALRSLQTKFGRAENLSVLGFKVFADGVLEYPTQTAAISMPYTNSGKSGTLMVDPDKLKSFITIADQNEVLVHIHAIGDRAVTESLNAFAEARQVNGNKRIPHSITHLQLVSPADFRRFSSLNVLPSMQLLWATADQYTIDLVKPYIDSSLFITHYPANSLLKAGATLCGASDWPVSSANPFEAIHMAETRKGSMGVLNEAERVARLEMIKAYTINAAKVLMMDNKIGSIEPGKQADFILVDRDVLHVDADSVKGTQIIWTIFNGEIVFENPNSQNIF